MDLSFHRGKATRAATPVALDYPSLIAILAAAQAGTRTAEVAGQLASARDAAVDAVTGLVLLLDPRGGWIAAARALGGSFNPEVMRHEQ